MSDHNCPRIDMKAKPIPVVYPDVHCCVCYLRWKEDHRYWLKYLPELRAWFKDGEDMSQQCWTALYEHFFEAMPYGTQTGDTGTIDEWALR
jgi:hypothetical protein